MHRGGLWVVEDDGAGRLCENPPDKEVWRELATGGCKPVPAVAERRNACGAFFALSVWRPNAKQHTPPFPPAICNGKSHGQRLRAPKLKRLLGRGDRAIGRASPGAGPGRQLPGNRRPIGRGPLGQRLIARTADST